MKFYHATHRHLVPRILREGLQPGPAGLVYLARSPQNALTQAWDAPPVRFWEENGLIVENKLVPKKDLVILEISGLTKADIVKHQDQWSHDEDLATSKSIKPKNLRRIKERY